MSFHIDPVMRAMEVNMPLHDRMARDVQMDRVSNPLQSYVHPEPAYSEPVNIWEPKEPAINTNMWEPKEPLVDTNMWTPKKYPFDPDPL